MYEQQKNTRRCTLVNKKNFTISGGRLLFALDLIYFVMALGRSTEHNKNNFSKRRIKNRMEKYYPALLRHEVIRSLYCGRHTDPGFDALHHILANTKDARSIFFNMQVILDACVNEWVRHYQTFDGPMGDFQKPLNQALEFFCHIASGKLCPEMLMPKKKKT